MAKLPSRYERMKKNYPQLISAYEKLGNECLKSGPLDEKTCALIKLGIAVGAGLEGAVHAHVRRSLEAGANPAEIRQTILLGTTTIGFPKMMSAFSWADDLLKNVKCRC